MPGVISGRVIRRIRLRNETPWTRALSSKTGSMARKEAAIMMKPTGTKAMPSTQPMPTRLTMLRGDRSSDSKSTRSLLMMPMRSWRRNPSHAGEKAGEQQRDG